MKDRELKALFSILGSSLIFWFSIQYPKETKEFLKAATEALKERKKHE